MAASQDYEDFFSFKNCVNFVQDDNTVHVTSLEKLLEILQYVNFDLDVRKTIENVIIID